MLATRRLLFVLALLAGFLPAALRADPPGRVGRLTVLEGPVLLRMDRQDPGQAATVNWPIAAGAIVDTEPGSRAEIWVESSAIRLGSQTRLEFSTLDDDHVVLNLGQGAVSVTLRDNEAAQEIEAYTPNGRIRFDGPGRYRIDTGGGRTNVSVHSGSARVTGRDRSVPVGAGQAASIDSEGMPTLYAEAPRDGLDDWASARDRETSAVQAARYVSPRMTGYADLDAYGDWGSVAEYGTVWYPRAISADWAPYRHGRWAWIEPWGWTWIDEAPWGFAPFHYGRWLLVRGRWAWIPGARTVRPVYAPALVAWMGNPGWSLSVSSGPAVGWFPLAPREVYVPSYRYSPVYLRRINGGHIRDSAVIERASRDGRERRFTYAHRPEAVTVVSTATLTTGRPVDGANARPPQGRDLRGAPVSTGAPGAGWVAPPDHRHRPHDPPAGRTPPVPQGGVTGTAPAGRPDANPGRNRDEPVRPPVQSPPEIRAPAPSGSATPREVRNPESQPQGRSATPPLPGHLPDSGGNREAPQSPQPTPQARPLPPAVSGAGVASPSPATGSPPPPQRPVDRPAPQVVPPSGPTTPATERAAEPRPDSGSGSATARSATPGAGTPVVVPPRESLPPPMRAIPAEPGAPRQPQPPIVQQPPALPAESPRPPRPVERAPEPRDPRTERPAVTPVTAPPMRESAPPSAASPRESSPPPMRAIPAEPVAPRPPQPLMPQQSPAVPLEAQRPPRPAERPAEPRELQRPERPATAPPMAPIPMRESAQPNAAPPPQRTVPPMPQPSQGQAQQRPVERERNGPQDREKKNQNH